MSKLFEINERGTFKPVNELDDAERKKQDEQLFQTGRLINCGFFGECLLIIESRVLTLTTRIQSIACSTITFGSFPPSSFIFLGLGEQP